MQKYVVVCGGVISGVGKGVASASIGRILKEYGFKVTCIKIDPYINCDAGTLRPTEHGEVWVTFDGGEIDQDLGNYERFLDIDIPKKNNLTTGQIYKKVIEKERKGEYLGETVQFIPHIPEEIKKRIKEASEGFDIVMIEIGGTIGDYENIPFLFAMKSLEREIGKENIIYGLVSYLPVPTNLDEMKTKPTQTSVKLLTESGIFPDFILCRAHKPLDSVRKKKIETYANIGADYVISAPDVKGSLYQIPLNFEKENLGFKLLKKLNLPPKTTPNWEEWKRQTENLNNPEKEIEIAIVGKYIDIGEYSLVDSYISINEALKHAGASQNVNIKLSWIDSKKFEKNPDSLKELRKYSGVIIPGGFGNSGVEGKIKTIQFVRENNIPFLGLCYGMQLAVVEFARNVCGLTEAHSTEVNPNTKHPVIDLLPEQRNISDKGGTMRLGAYAAKLESSKILSLYQESGRIEKDANRIAKIKENNSQSFRIGNTVGENVVLEIHRHRYEQSNEFVSILEDHGLSFPGKHKREDGTELMEFIELPSHQFFIATQAHPEFTSRFTKPNPLFYGFVRAASGYTPTKDEKLEVEYVRE